TFNVQPLTIEFFASKGKWVYRYENLTCQDEGICHDLKVSNSINPSKRHDIVSISFDPQSTPVGSWYLWEGNFSLSGLFDPNYDYLYFQILNEFENTE